MTQKALSAIAEAETQADVLCRVAAEKAAEMKQKIKTEGEAHLAKVREETTLEYQNELAAITARTARLRERKHEEAEREAKSGLAYIECAIMDGDYTVAEEALDDVFGMEPESLSAW